ncbi:MAG: GNAT family N-acetyltransferase [Chloroflexota bacterium]|nr:GNAT family N-acetyltransferase [Chloroflexota bacterium]
MADSDGVISSERLDLALLSLDQLDLVAAGDSSRLAAELGATIPADWASEVRGLAARRAQQIRERPSDAPWLLRAIVLRPADAGDERRAIGYLNFHAAPDESGTAEIGYTLLPEARGHGYAIEAVRAAFEWATRVHGIRRFRASVSPDNERSLNLIGRLGFHRTGEQWDPEDGLELVFELEL